MANINPIIKLISLLSNLFVLLLYLLFIEFEAKLEKYWNINFNLKIPLIYCLDNVFV